MATNRSCVTPTVKNTDKVKNTDDKGWETFGNIIIWIANANLFPWKELNMKTSCSKSEISVLEMIKNVRI